MNIYLVTERDYDGDIIHGVYSNEVAALEHQKAGGMYPTRPEYEPWPRYSVDEYVVLDTYQTV
jgi:hypothetical protein